MVAHVCNSSATEAEAGGFSKPLFNHPTLKMLISGFSVKNSKNMVKGSCVLSQRQTIVIKV